MASASIKREENTDRITGGKDYPVIGFMGGCVIIVDDKNQFMSLSFASIAVDWTISVSDPKPDAPKGKS